MKEEPFGRGLGGEKLAINVFSQRTAPHGGDVIDEKALVYSRPGVVQPRIR
ncbi:MAG: hypothetical protein SVR04_16115 [Spirochaetota bacterium]|nr:hypothetical protein [Spirochaetota bacterium]